MKEKFSIRVNHFAAKTIDAVGVGVEKFATTFLILILSGTMAYAGYTSNLASLLFLSAIVFVVCVLILAVDFFAVLKKWFSDDNN